MRRVLYTPELGEIICKKIAEGESLRSICAREDFPSVGGFLGWVAKSERGEEQYAGLVEQYARAMEQRTECMAEDILEIADDVGEDFVDTENGPRFNAEAVQRSKLRVETRNGSWAR